MVAEFLPYLVLIGVMLAFWFFLMRQQTGGGKGVMNFSKSRARLTDPSKNRVTFKDVAGADEERDELKEIVEFLEGAGSVHQGGRAHSQGRTCWWALRARAKRCWPARLPGEAGVPFFTISGSDFVEMFVGVGASPRARLVRSGQEERRPRIVFHR